MCFIAAGGLRGRTCYVKPSQVGWEAAFILCLAQAMTALVLTQVQAP